MRSETQKFNISCKNVLNETVFVNYLIKFIFKKKGIMSDVFPEKKRALVMAIFNWGIYGGYGIAFPVGRYVTKSNIWDLVCIKIRIKHFTFLMMAFLPKSYRFTFAGLANLLLWYGCACCNCCCIDWNHVERARTKSNWRRPKPVKCKWSQKSFTFQSVNAAKSHFTRDCGINSSLRWHDLCIQR